MKKFQFPILLFLTLLASNTFGHLNESVKTATLQGVVLDEADGSALEYATVSIVSLEDSSLVTGGITDSVGFFQIRDVKYGKYSLKIRYMGYSPYAQSDILVDENIVGLGQIEMESEGIALAEVRMEGELDELEIKIDKRVFRANKSLVSAGGSGLDLLRDVPSVEVDENDNISLRGEGNITILIDGRPSNMPAGQYLKMLSAESIDKVEIITNPSAKYNPEGVGGILNIITKKNKSKGINGQFSSGFSYSRHGRVRGTALLNFRSPRFNVYTNYVYSNRRSSTWLSTERKVLLADSIWDVLLSRGGEISHSESHYVKYGLDYFLNENNTLYFSGTFNRIQIDKEFEIAYVQQDEAALPINSSFRNGPSSIPLGRFSYNSGWQHTFSKPGATLDLDLNYSGNYYDAYEDFQEMSEDETSFDQSQSTGSRDDNTLFLSRMDLIIPFNSQTRLESGLYYRSRNSLSNFYSSTWDNLSGTLEDSIVDEFQYTEQVAAAYATLSRQYKKLGIQLGARMEQSYTKSTVLATNLVYPKQYFKLYPTLHLSYKVNKKHSLGLSYGKRINRPAMEMLNPFSFFSDRFTLENGDPTLQPEIIHVNELTYLLSSEKITFSASLYNRFILNRNRRHMRYDGLITTVTYKDVAESNFTGSELMLNYKLNRIVKLNFTANVWNYRLADEYITDGEIVNSLGMNSGLNIHLNFGKGIRAQVRNFYRPKFKIQQGYMEPRFAMFLAISKSLLDGNGKISLNLRDALNTSRSYYRSYPTADFSFRGDWDWESRIVYINFSLSLGKEIKGKDKRRVSNEDGSDQNQVPGM